MNKEKELNELFNFLFDNAENYCDDDGFLCSSRLAKMLYDEGYRKVSDLEIIITKEKYEKYNKTVIKICNETRKEILQGFFDWTESAIADSYDKSVKGSKHDGGRNSAFHEVRKLILKVAEEYGVKIEK